MSDVTLDMESDGYPAKVVVALPLSPAQRLRLQATLPCTRFLWLDYGRAAAEDVADADVIVGSVDPALLAETRRLRLLQLSSAGYDRYTDDVMPAGAALCCATGAFGQAVSEHLFAMVLAQLKKLPGYRDLQRSCEWGDLGPVRSLVGARVLVLGAGDIGTHLAQLFSAFGAHVDGVRSRETAPHEPFERMGTLADLGELLPQADVVASVLPSNDATRGLADEAFFAAMKRGAIFANAGRGDLVDQAALAAALESGQLGGACLDVTSPEPLPADDPLWNAPNCTITPHISGFFHLDVTLDNIVDIAAENLAHLASGEPLRNQVRPNSR